MGCGASTSTTGPKAPKAAADEPELMGKAKFLSCPSIAEVTDAATDDRWVLLAFAPLHYHGLIFAARRFSDGALRVRSMVDSEVSKHREAQRVQLSFNLFFKAISTEVSKAGKAGAKVTFNHDAIDVECKIGVPGNHAQKKPDLYTVTLEAVDATDENLFRYIAEPFATHFTKKRTDGWSAERPDANKDRMFGELEANAIVRAGSIRRSTQLLKQTIPTLAPLRERAAAARIKGEAAAARLVSLRTAAEVGPAAYVDPFAPQSRAPGAVLSELCRHDTAGLEPRPLGSVAGSAWDACKAAGGASGPDPAAVFLSKHWGTPMSFDGQALDEASGGHALALTLYAAVHSTGVAEDAALSDDALRAFALRLEHTHRAAGAFYGTGRAAERVHVAALLAPALPSTDLRYAALLGAAALHAGRTAGRGDDYHRQTLQPTTLTVLYGGRAPCERHGAALALDGAAAAGLSVPATVAACVAEIAVAAEASEHAPLVDALRRSRTEVTGTGAQRGRLHVAGFVKAADLCFVAVARDRAARWSRLMCQELAAQDVLLGGEAQDRAAAVIAFARQLALPLFDAVAAVAPQARWMVQGCNTNYPAPAPAS